MRLIKAVLVLTGVAFCFEGQAQSLVSFSGGAFQNSVVNLSFSAGDVIAGTFEGSSVSVVGGFSNGSNLMATSNELSSDDLPQVFRLNQNYPNPFNPSTNISFELPKTSAVQLEVFNSIGAKVAVLASGQKPAGILTVTFDASNLASGMYFYRLTAQGNVIATKKMLLIK